ncbi:MAG: 50S ribosomal protein L21e [Candidatus Marsarchaeota archaeon]|jgi:large subunit ribosomal protein L21e|nr:50S ribosomal protein L21e [Candidatus Marsarchaeota archaeon]
MAGRSHGLFAGRSRHLSRHDKLSTLGISRLINKFSVGEKVVVVPHGSFRNIPHPRYKGRVGSVVGSRGKAYVIEIELSKSMKRTLVVPQEYLQRLPLPGPQSPA